MKIGYFLIVLIILVTNSVQVFSDGLEHLDKLLQKPLRYKNHQLNYEESLHLGDMPKGLRIRKDPVFEPMSDVIYFCYMSHQKL